ncbi:TolC family protein [Pedobacter immunditicola]|uniref:TolC family protein n=1 Tax=Pedobacter immunditicola TaxID=3133440 RepID=UPI0030A07D42
MKKYILFIVVFSMLHNISAQETGTVLTIEECYALAQAQYPLSKKRDLMKKSSEFTIGNLSKGYLPRFDIFGQASYQSEVTKVPVSTPGLNIPELNKDQYKLYGEFNQLLYDGGIIKQQKLAAAAQLKVQDQQIQVELYQLKERIADLYFGILVINEQLKQNQLLKNDIQIGINTVSAQLKNGTAYRSSVDLLRAEYLKAEQQAISIRSYKKAYAAMLGLFINREVRMNTLLKVPTPPLLSLEINRPELNFFNYSGQSFELDKKSINAGNRPKLNLFFQGGIGNPALNFLKEAFEPYYIGGIRLAWSFTGFYTSKKQQQIIDLKIQEIETEKETFLFNTTQAVKQQEAEISMLNEYLVSDDEIITLRNNVKKAALAQLENGVISPADYLKEVNEENQAVQNKIIHQTELRYAQFKHQLITGN